MKRILISGSSGLVGSEVAAHFDAMGFDVHGIDNNQRAVFFGTQGDTRWNQHRLEKQLRRFVHHEIDIRDRRGVVALVKEFRPHLIVHAAAQPSHDLAARMPFDDFEINAGGTLNMLEAARQNCPDSPFVHMSTNKVYGDAPNAIPLVELPTRWDYADERFQEGIDETFSIDQSKHTLFGVSKVAADLLVQEYGRYFGMPTCCLRAGCVTGPNHSGAELHGFLSHLARCSLNGTPYTVFGYKGKQVRDNIHAKDVARFVQEFHAAPRAGEVYNLGGGKQNSCSILEAFRLVEQYTGRPFVHSYVADNRIGDHICYYSDLRKARSHYPQWDITRTLHQTVEEIVTAWRERPVSA
jgi:CDP-paratose 2-epimerase